MVDKVREIALKALYKIDKEDGYSNIVLDDVINNNRNNLTFKDVGLISQIVYGVTTWRLTLDTIIEKHSNLKLKKISPWILNILRMGIYQIIFLDKIPIQAAVDESVNLAKRYGHKGSSGFVNAVLRKVNAKDYEELFKIENDIERISKTQSMPIWIIEELLKNNNIKEVEEICKSLNLKPTTTIRVNTLKITSDELCEKFKAKDIQYEKCEQENFFVIKNARNIEQMEEFKQGLFTVQDESAGLTAIILSPNKNEYILDACSAPGGKTTHIAEIMENCGKIDAFDIHEHRLKLIQQNCDRLGVTIVSTQLHDATEKIENSKEYDRVLLDVPCLGIGVIKRKPDIKWQRKKEDIKEISDLQYQILDNCSKNLKNGGELVYSTCSILKEENDDIIDEFLLKNNSFKIVKKIRINPSEKHDGFYICKLKNRYLNIDFLNITKVLQLHNIYIKNIDFSL